MACLSLKRLEDSRCFSYANSALNLLFHSSNFCQWLQKKREHHKECPTMQNCVLCQLVICFKNYLTEKPLSILSLLTALKNCEWRDLNLLKPQSVVMFLNILLRHLESHHHLAEFMLTTVKSKECIVCGHRIAKDCVTTSHSLSLELFKNSSISDALASKFACTMLFAESTCVFCKKFSMHEFEEKIMRLPNILLLEEASFSNNKEIKKSTFNMGYKIMLSDFCISTNNIEGSEFQCSGYITTNQNLNDHNYSAICRKDADSFQNYENGQVFAVGNQNYLPCAPVVVLYEVNYRILNQPPSLSESRPSTFLLGQESKAKKRTHNGEMINEDVTPCTTNVVFSPATSSSLPSCAMSQCSISNDEEEILTIGRNLMYPKTQEVAFFTCHQMQLLFYSNRIPFPYQEYCYINENMLKNDPNPNTFILKEFQETEFPPSGSTEFFERRTSYLNRLSLKLLGGLFICLDQCKKKQILKYLRGNPRGTKQSQYYERSHCKLCLISFKSFEGIYLHLVRNHTPTQYLMKEELICLGLKHGNNNDWMFKRNQQLSAIIQIQTMALIQKIKEDANINCSINSGRGLVSSILKCDLDKLQKTLVHQYGNNPAMLLQTPDNLLHFVDPRPWKFNLKGFNADEKEVLYQKMSKSMHHFFVQKKDKRIHQYKVYVIALVDEDTNELIEKSYNGDIGHFMISDSKEELSSPIILYVGKVSSEAGYSSYHFNKCTGSVVTSYWRSGAYYPWLLSTQLCDLDPASKVPIEEQLIVAELKKILTIKIWSSMHFKEKNLMCVAPQTCHAVHVKKYIPEDWLYKCVTFCKSMRNIFSFKPTSEFEVKLFCCHQITKLFKITEKQRNEQLGDEIYCYKCDLLLPTSRIAKNHLELHRKRSRISFGKNLDSLLSSSGLMRQKSTKDVVSAILILCRSAVVPTESLPGLYLVAIDMLETITLEFEDLERELKKFIETGMDTTNRTQRFLFYVGKNSNGGFPSYYHSVEMSNSSVKKINRPAYCIQGWDDKGENEDLCLLILFIKKCLQKRNHINFINCQWNMAKIADKFSVDLIQRLLVTVDDDCKIFCTIDNCNDKHDDEFFFSSIHINASKFKIIQEYDPEKPVTQVKRVRVRGFLSFMNSQNIFCHSKQIVRQKHRTQCSKLINLQDWILQAAEGHKKKIASKKNIASLDVALLTYPYKQPSHLMKVLPSVKSETTFTCLFCRCAFDEEYQMLLHLAPCMTCHFQQKISDNCSFHPLMETCLQTYTIPVSKNVPFLASSNNQDRPIGHDIANYRVCKICNVFLNSTNAFVRHFYATHKDLLGEKRCFYCLDKIESKNNKSYTHFGIYYHRQLFNLPRFYSSSLSSSE